MNLDSNNNKRDTKRHKNVCVMVLHCRYVWARRNDGIVLDQHTTHSWCNNGWLSIASTPV